MNILIANKFYYNRGGDCIASIALEQLLKAKGHRVAFFSMQHPQNFPSEWSEFFPSNVDFQAGGISSKLKAAGRIFGAGEVRSRFLKLVDRFKPDVLHLNNIHSQLSPVIGELAHQKGIKVVWTLHDYKLVCPNYICLKSGKPCEECLQWGAFPALRNRCMKGSLPASLLAFMESVYWNRERLINNTDYFVAPSSFMKQIMVRGGFPKAQVKVIPNFMNRDFSGKSETKSDYYCYVGRLSGEKGVQTLLDAAKELPYRLFIVGTGPLKDSLPDTCGHIRFLGFKEWNELKPIVSRARFVVVPSEWYENNPFSVIETHCLGTPVLGANIGGIPELIDAPANGMLFEPGNKEELKTKIETMYNASFDYDNISTQAIRRFSAETYYDEIIKLYR